MLTDDDDDDDNNSKIHITGEAIFPFEWFDDKKKKTITKTNNKPNMNFLTHKEEHNAAWNEKKSKNGKHQWTELTKSWQMIRMFVHSLGIHINALWWLKASVIFSHYYNINGIQRWKVEKIISRENEHKAEEENNIAVLAHHHHSTSPLKSSHIISTFSSFFFSSECDFFLLYWSILYAHSICFFCILTISHYYVHGKKRLISFLEFYNVL